MAQALQVIPKPQSVISIHQELFFACFKPKECVLTRLDSPGHAYQPMYYDKEHNIAIVTSAPWERIEQWLPGIDYNYENKYYPCDYHQTDGCRRVQPHLY